MMKTKNTYLNFISGVIFGFLYSLIPMYVNVILVQRIVEYVTDLRLVNLMMLCMVSAIIIIVAELLNSIYENKIRPELKLVCLDINGRCVLDDICLKIEKGDKTALIGRNASGKTTVMKTLAGMLDITSGEIYLNQNKV